MKRSARASGAVPRGGRPPRGTSRNAPPGDGQRRLSGLRSATSRNPRPPRVARHRAGGDATLAGRAGRALGWSFTNSTLGKLGTVGVGIMLARLLGPHAFGVYAVAYVAQRILVNLNDLGVGLAIVRWPGDPAEVAPTIATIATGTSLALYAGCYFGAPAYAAAMGDPAATSVVRVLCLVVIVDGIVATPIGLLTRNFRQDLRMVVDQINIWLGTAVTVALALSGFGAMSLAIGRLAGCAAALVPLLMFSPQPLRFGFDRAKARALLRFGLPLAGSNVILFIVENVDQLVVGRVLGVTALGFFALASNLSNWPLTIFSQPVRNVAPATFSRLRHDPAAMRSGFLSVAELLGAITLPVCLAISAAAVPLVGLVYGARWLPAAQALLWLSALSALQIFFELTYDFFVVLAKSRVVLVLQLVWIAVLIPALVAGARVDGIAGLSMAEAAVAAGLVLPWYVVELHKAGVRSLGLAGRLWLPLTGGAAAGLLAGVAARVAPNDLTALIAGGAAGLAVIGLLLYYLRPVIAALRQISGDTLSQPGADPVPDPDPDPDPVTAGPAPGKGSPRTDADGKAADMLSLPPDAWPARPAVDTTGPLPLRPDVRMSFPSRQSPGGAQMPLYRATVASQRWDPAATADRGFSTRPSRHRSVGPPGPGLAAPGNGRAAPGGGPAAGPRRTDAG